MHLRKKKNLKNEREVAVIMKNLLILTLLSMVSLLMFTSCSRTVIVDQSNINVLRKLGIERDQVEKITLFAHDGKEITDKEEIKLICRKMQRMEYMNGVGLSSEMTFHLKNGEIKTIEMDWYYPHLDQGELGEVYVAVDGYMDEYSSKELYVLLEKYLPKLKPRSKEYKRGESPYGKYPSTPEEIERQKKEASEE